MDEENNISMIESLQDYKDSHIYEHQLSSLIIKNLSDKFKSRLNTTPHLFLTDLCNPANAYWSRIGVESKKSPELQAKLSKGNLLHSLFERWIRKIDGIVDNEVIVDGSYVGIDGVRGRIDTVIDNSTYLELKTKDELPKDVDEIKEKYPQDIEQLSFYAALSCEKETKNYLVFMNNKEPYEFKVFKIILKDKGNIRNKIKERINIINKALDEKRPEILGQCRNFKNGCNHNENSLCTCKDLDLLNTSYFEKCLEITEDVDFKNKIEKCIDEKKEFCFYKNNILSPRKYYLNNKTKFVPVPFDSNFKDTWEPLVQNAVYGLNKNLSIDEKKEIRKNEINNNLKIGFKWLKLPKTGKKDGEKLPYIIKVSKATYISNPNEFHVADLAVVVSNYKNISSGLLIVVYPFLSTLKVFRINFKNLKKLKTDIKKISDILDKLEIKPEEFTLSDLPPCHSLFNKGGKCPLSKECNKNGNVCLN